MGLWDRVAVAVSHRDKHNRLMDSNHSPIHKPQAGMSGPSRTDNGLSLVAVSDVHTAPEYGSEEGDELALAAAVDALIAAKNAAEQEQGRQERQRRMAYACS